MRAPPYPYGPVGRPEHAPINVDLIGAVRGGTVAVEGILDTVEDSCCHSFYGNLALHRARPFGRRGMLEQGLLDENHIP